MAMQMLQFRPSPQPVGHFCLMFKNGLKMFWGETVKKIVFWPRPWPPVAVAARGRPWPPVAVRGRGRPWPPVAARGRSWLWPPVAARGRPWPLVAVAARGRPWPWPDILILGETVKKISCFWLD